MISRIVVACAALLAFEACPKKDTPPPPPELDAGPKVLAPSIAPPSKPAQPASAECEFMGTWSPGATSAAKYAFVAQVPPCSATPTPATLGSMPLSTPGSFFAEFFVPQGTSGHLCLFGYDASGAIVAVGEPAGNPVRFEGEGEVMFTGLSITVAAVPAVPAATPPPAQPVPAPAKAP